MSRPSASPQSGSGVARLVSAVTATLEPVAAASGFDLEGVEVVPAGRRKVLRVVVDRDGGVDLDAVAVASREFSAALDAGSVMGETAYVLEVTSPGVDRPLTAARHWRRAMGRLVEVPTPDGSTVRGRITDADDAAVTFDVDGAERVIALSDLGSGRVQLEFERSGGGAA
jgi:ribosome maturation factor RimP